MHFKSLMSTAAAIALGSTQVAAISHGDVQDYNGSQVKWQQVGKGMWSGVPVEEWDDSVHKRSDVDYGTGNIDARSLMTRDMENGARSLELESRNFESFCQAVATCAKADGVVQLVGCMGVYIEAVNAAATSVGTIWDLLNEKPFITTVVGGTIATIVGIRGEKTIWPPPAEECSTQQTDKDAFSSAVHAALSANPGASSISVDVTGPEFSYTASITVVPENNEPPTPKVGECFNA